MSRSGNRANGPRRLVLSFVLLLLLPAAAVVWLGLALLRQDRDLEARQRQERRATAADQVVAGLAQAMTATERQLTAWPPALRLTPGGDAAVVMVRGATVEAIPAGSLLYVAPDANPAADPAGAFDAFEAGERLEFREQDFRGAAAIFRSLTGSADSAIRAGALLRLARTLRHLARPREALRIYAELASMGGVRLAGVPAELAARHAQGRVLHDLGDALELARVGRALRHDLLAARWTIDRATYSTYYAEASGWIGDAAAMPPERVALADGAVWAVEHAASGSRVPGEVRRVAVRIDGVDLTIVSQAVEDRMVTLVAGPGFQHRAWFSAIERQVEAGRFSLALSDSDGHAVIGAPGGPDAATVTRSAAESGLPWAIGLRDRDPSLDAAAGTRRRLLVAGLAVLLAVVIAGGTFTSRAVSRELAAVRVQSDFVSAVSHEFRTPLTSLRQFTDLLTEDEELPPAKRRAFHDAQARATSRLQRLVESLLDFGRMQAGARPYALEPWDAGELAQAVVIDFRRESPLPDSAVGFECDGPAPIQGDRDALALALWNLLDNAAKYSVPPPEIRVSVRVRDREVAIAVQDRGWGIPAEEHREIFEQFRRGRAAHLQGVRGTGIGLAMVAHIVRGHRGRIDVESTPQQGSTFTILLPTASRRADRGGRAGRTWFG
jgi:signal transduction histidine kinase